MAAALGVLGSMRGGGGGDGSGLRSASRHLENMETFRRSLPHSHAPQSHHEAASGGAGGGEKQAGGAETTGQLRCALPLCNKRCRARRRTPRGVVACALGGAVA
jgi:hypothetical protein